MEQKSNDSTISTLYWEDSNGHPRYVQSRVNNDQRNFGILRKKLQGASGEGSSSKKEAIPKATQVSETSNSKPQEPKLMVQDPLLSRGIPTLVKGSIAVVEEPELEVGAKCSIQMVDVVINRVTCGDPLPHNALPILLNPTHITDTAVEDGINIQPYLEVVYKVKENECQINAVSKPVGMSKDPSPRIAVPTSLHPLIGVLPDQMGVGLTFWKCFGVCLVSRQ